MRKNVVYSLQHDKVKTQTIGLAYKYQNVTIVTFCDIFAMLISLLNQPFYLYNAGLVKREKEMLLLI